MKYLNAIITLVLVILLIVENTTAMQGIDYTCILSKEKQDKFNIERESQNRINYIGAKTVYVPSMASEASLITAGFAGLLEGVAVGEELKENDDNILKAQKGIVSMLKGHYLNNNLDDSSSIVLEYNVDDVRYIITLTGVSWVNNSTDLGSGTENSDVESGELIGHTKENSAIKVIMCKNNNQEEINLIEFYSLIKTFMVEG